MHFYRRTLSYVLQEFRWILVLVVLITLGVGLSTIAAWPLPLLIDCLTGKTLTGLVRYLCRDNRAAGIAFIVAAFFVIKLLQDGLSLCGTMVGLRVKYSTTKRVRRDLFSHIQHLGSVYFKTHAQGDAIFRLTNDTYGPYGVFDTVLMSLQASAKLICYVAVMLTRNVPLTLFVISLAPFLAVANWYFGRRIKRRTDESRQVDADMITIFQRSLAALKITQLFSRRSHEEERFEDAQSLSVGAALRLNWQENLYPFVVQTLFGLGQVSILAVGAYLVLSPGSNPNTHTISGGDLLLFIAYFNQIQEPLSLVFGFGARVKGSIAATERVYAILDQFPVVVESSQTRQLPAKPRNLTLDKVWFTYEKGESATLCGLSAEIPAGTMVAFVGVSGAGKSTLLELLSRLHDPSSGRILLDGADLRHLSFASLRQHIAVVSQDYAVMPGTIWENIRYGRPQASDAEVLAAASQAGVDLLVQSLPQGYETQIAEAGQNLSAGQRQRIVIARALLTQAPILVLDEPTSALDPQQETMLMHMLHSLKGNRTIILVTHRMDTVAESDQIYVLRHGRIFEHGTHRQLLELHGVYFEMLHADEQPASSVIPIVSGGPTPE